MKRKIVNIDEDKCNGCGLCVPSCAEGAIQIIDGKAKLVKDSYCDGLGACLGDCPQDAITIEEREADPFDEEAVEKHLAAQKQEQPKAASPPKPHGGGGCPGMMAMKFGGSALESESSGADTPDVSPELRQWPVQMHLVSPAAPYWQGADILVCADCVPVAYGDFQKKLLKGKKVIIACPKLDETSGYLEKLTAILQHNDVKSVTVAHMEVPCCTGLVHLVRSALEQSGKDIEYNDVTVGIKGELM